MRNDFLTDIEWVRIAPDKVVVATADRVWLYRPGSGDSNDVLAQPRSGTSTLATTQNFLIPPSCLPSVQFCRATAPLP